MFPLFMDKNLHNFEKNKYNYSLFLRKFSKISIHYWFLSIFRKKKYQINKNSHDFGKKNKYTVPTHLFLWKFSKNTRITKFRQFGTNNLNKEHHEIFR